MHIIVQQNVFVRQLWYYSDADCCLFDKLLILRHWI